MHSLFKHEQDEAKYYDYYDQTLKMFELDYESVFVNTSYGNTHVLIFGDKSKKPLLLLHGMTMSSAMWYPNVKQLITERCVYAVDVLGDFGKSKVATIINTKQAAANWMLEVVDGLELGSCDIAGHSMGGFLALNFTFFYPTRVDKLVLYAPAATFQPLKFMFFIKVFPAILLQSKRLTDKAFLWFSGDKKPLHPTFRNQIISAYTTAKPLLQLIPSVFSDDEFQNFKHKTLLLVGNKEVIYNANKLVEKATQLIPNLQSHLISGANHALTVEQADIVNELTLAFLRDRSDS